MQTKEEIIKILYETTKEASNNAMNKLSYIIIAKDGWIIKEFRNGNIKKIKPIEDYEKFREFGKIREFTIQS